jgi:putative MFS transporter
MNKSLIVLIAALGYFVDVFDLVLFSVVRTQSLQDLGLSGDALLADGVRLLNAQMLGMLVGGVLFGVLGDRLGRIQVLFGSILLYSLANIANGFVTTVDQYQIMRFITGVGLAGEVGGAITIVSEVLSRERRGLGTALVTTAGALGAIVASYSATLLSWRLMYIIGGVMGLVLLVLRVAIAESSVFESIKRDRTVSKGNLLLVLGNRERLSRFLALIAIGIPFMFSWGLIATFSPEIALATIGVKISSAPPISMFCIGVTLGDIACGVFSQYLKSRKQAMGIFLAAQTITIFGVLHLHGSSETIFTMWFFPIGFFGGLWAVLLTTASEQFGTNIRATVTSTVPNFVRGCTVPLSFAFLSCKEALDIVSSVQIVCAISVAGAVVGLKMIRESFGISLSYIEVTSGQSDYGSIATDNATDTSTVAEDQLPRASGF